MKDIIRKHPRRTIASGFLGVIFTGAILLMLPISLETGKSITFVESLFTSTSAVCITGLVVTNTAETFSVFGEGVIASLIQVGGLGITSIGVITILLASGRVNVGSRVLAKTALNISSEKGLKDVIRGILYVTLTFELTGALLGYLAFFRSYGLGDGVGISIFHSISSFNNAGFDIFSVPEGMTKYHDNLYVNFLTMGLIIAGGIGFTVVREVYVKRSFRKLSLHAKMALTMTVCLIVGGTILIKLSQGTTWLSALFHSVSSRTAGFATEDMGKFSTVTLLIIILLMFIGASPGSTGGGIKTTTFFVILRNIRAVALNKNNQVFKRKISDSIIARAYVIVILAMTLVFWAIVLISLFQPELALRDVFFETVSAFANAGLSTGITPELSNPSKIVICITMYVGRIGPLTIISLWWKKKKPQVKYVEDNVVVG